MTEHHPHHEHPHHHETEPIISRGWQIATVLGNAVVGAAEIAGGLAAAAYSVVADGAHNGADVYTYWLQSKNILHRHKLSPEKQQRNRKIAHWVLCATSLGVAAKAGSDLAMDKESIHNTMNIYTAAASVAFNGLLFAGLYRGIRRRKREAGQGMDHLEKDITKHFAFSDMPSAALALGGAYLHSKGMIGAEQVAAIASGVLSAAVFRPTKKNLAHDHDHFGETTSDGYHQEYSRSRSKKPRWRRAAAALASLAIIGGLMGESIANQDREEAAHSFARHDSFKTEVAAPVSPPETPELYECVTVESGDSLWALAEEQVEQVFDNPPSNAQVNAVTLLAASQTELVNPDFIRPNECVSMPNSAALEVMFTSPQLQGDVNQLNTVSWDELATQDHLFDAINQKLEQNVAG